MRSRGNRRSFSRNVATSVGALFIGAFLWLTWWELSYQSTSRSSTRWLSEAEVRATTGAVLLPKIENRRSEVPSPAPPPREGYINDPGQALETVAQVPVVEDRGPPLSVLYRVVLLSRATEAADTYCIRQGRGCSEYRAYEAALLRHATSGGHERLHLVPVDPLSMIRESEPRLYTQLLDSLVETMNTDRYYITYKGSDYVFICLVSDCQRFAEELGEKLADEKGTRAIFVGTDLDRAQLNWPCPLRVVELDKSALLDTESLPETILNATSAMVDRQQRWICADNEHPAHRFGQHNESMGYGGLMMKKYGFMMCAIPKSGSTMMKFLFRRMLDKPDWKSRENGLPHNPALSGLKNIKRANKESVKRIYDELSILKAAVVRHPIPRFLSGYLDKIKILKEYQRVQGLTEYVEQHGAPSFSEFMDYLFRQYPNPDNLDEHFRIQSSECGLRDHRFDFVGSLSNLGTEFKEFAESLGFYEDYVESGWGGDEKQQFGVKAYQPDQRWSGMQIWDYYTEELMMKVYEYYREDFDRFGFSIEEALATKPTASAS